MFVTGEVQRWIVDKLVNYRQELSLMSTTNERNPLLDPQPSSTPHRANRSNSLAVSLSRLRSQSIQSFNDGVSIISSIRDYVKEKYPSLATRKFIAAIIWGLVAVFIFNLIFLPRTSLGGDYRRIHFSTLSKHETQRLFLKSLRDENNAREYLEKYTNTPHLTGQGEDLVKYTIDKFKEFGFKPYTKKYYVYLNEHVNNSLTLFDSENDSIFEANLNEDPIVEDPASTNPNGIPAFHAYSASGNVTAEYIYANYGSAEDYKLLEENGVDVKDKIHIIRYNKLFRGLKVKHAENSGAVGVVLYTDPFDDGLVTEKNGYAPYPEGPARNPSSIQRGSVQYFTESPGDPTTPGYPSTYFAKRLDPSDKLPKIPSLAISQRDAAIILQKLNGYGTTLNWTGNLDEFDYSTGPSPKVTLNLYNEQNYKTKPITDILYEIPGLLNEKIYLGNHRDSWTVSGAGDPNSGSAILLEISRAFGFLVKAGWKPLRTIVVASWDGEEYGMLGSTEYGEEKAKDLQNHVVAYLNLDMGVAGPKLVVDSNPLLDHFLRQASRYIPFKNDTDYSLYEYWEKQDGNNINTLGSGSDFTVFQHHLGIPSCMISFNLDGKSPAYHVHSNYDSFHWIEKFIDPDFQLHNTLAKYIGFLALSFSENEVIEYQVSHYAKEIEKEFLKYVKQIPKTWLSKVIAIDHRKQGDVSYLIETVKQHLNKFIETSQVFDERAIYLQEQISIDYAWFQAYIKLKLAIDIKVLDNKSKRLDRLFLYEKGLKDRPWMRHSILAPDRETGYSGDTLPGLHEAIKDGDQEEFVKWLKIIDGQVKSANRLLRL